MINTLSGVVIQNSSNDRITIELKTKYGERFVEVKKLFFSALFLLNLDDLNIMIIVTL